MDETPKNSLDRRQFALLTLLAPALAACSGEGAPPPVTPATPGPTTNGAPAASPERLEVLSIRHPQNLAFSAPFTLIDSEGRLGEIARNLDVDVWTSPDVLRSLLVNDESDVTAVPTYVGANLANRGVEVRMAAVVVWGLLWLIGPEGSPPHWENLRGQRVMVPFPNDMPDLVFRYLAAAHGLPPGQDFTIEYYAQPPEVVSRLVSGEGSWGVLPEHTATVTLAQASQNGQDLGRVLDLQEEWASATGSGPRIPQAGIVVPRTLAEDRPDVVGAVLDELERAVAAVNRGSAATISALSEASGVPAPLVEQVIPRLNLEVVPAGQARPELETFYTELATLSPDIIGGGLPGASFYLDDPR